MNEYIFDVNIDEFSEKVIDASFNRTVIVDFWADWCGPCKMLGPVLEKIVNSYNGKAVLARVDVDSNSELAGHYGIQSIPSVLIFKDGNAVNGFTGAVPEKKIQELLKPYISDENENLLAAADNLLIEGRLKEAEKIYRAFLEKNPKSFEAVVGLARIFLEKDDTPAALNILNDLEENEKLKSDVISIKALAGFKDICRDTGGIKKSVEIFKKDPENMENLYNLGCCFAANKQFGKAFESFFSILKKNIDFGNGKAKKALISMFDVAGLESPLTSEYRKKLSNLLF